MNTDRKIEPNDVSLIIQEGQLSEYLNVGKTMLTEWLNDGRLRYFRSKPGGTRFFIVKYIEEDMINMYNTYNSDDKYDIGGN